jgi:hypothetical protein
MAGFVIAGVGAAALAVLAAMGLASRQGKVIGSREDRERVLARQEAGERASTSTAACTAVQNGSQPQACKNCPPDQGTTFQRNFTQPKEWIGYQTRITGMPSGPTFITEWLFRGVYFDGFRSSECLLMEAKATYDQFFDMWGEFKYPFQRQIFIDMTEDALKQNLVAVPKPPVQLRWYFQEPVSFRFMQKILNKAAPEIEVIYQP